MEQKIEENLKDTKNLSSNRDGLPCDMQNYWKETQ